MTRDEDTTPGHPNARAGERLVTQFTRQQRGWAAAILVAFLGVTYGGPALTRMGQRRRRAQQRIADRARAVQAGVRHGRTELGRRVRRLGGGAIWR